MKRELDLWHITNECVNCIYICICCWQHWLECGRRRRGFILCSVSSLVMFWRARPQKLYHHTLSLWMRINRRASKPKQRCAPRNYYQQPYLNCFFIYNVCICNAHCLLHFGNISIFCGPPLLHHDDDDDEVSDLGENATL